MKPLCCRGLPINPRTRPHFIPSMGLTWSASFLAVFGRYREFQPFVTWTYSPCETTFQAIFGDAV